MLKVLSSLILIISIILQASCQTVPLEGQLKEPTSLVVSIPKKSLDLKFVNGYKQVKQSQYYYESSRWINKKGTIDFFVSYTYLLSNYIFLNESTVEDLIQESFEDRVLSTGKEKTITKVINKTPKKVEYISIVPFTLENANCHYFRRYRNFTGLSYDYVSGGASIFDVKGDAKITGYLCNYGSTSLSDVVLYGFIGDIKAGKISINPHLKELKNINDDQKS